MPSKDPIQRFADILENIILIEELRGEWISGRSGDVQCDREVHVHLRHIELRAMICPACGRSAGTLRQVADIGSRLGQGICHCQEPLPGAPPCPHLETITIVAIGQRSSRTMKA